MKNNSLNSIRILAIAPNKDGFGFAFMRDAETLLDWGTKSAGKGSKNANSLSKIKKLMCLFQLEALILPDVLEKGSHRNARMKKLVRQVNAFTRRKGLKVKIIGRESVRASIFGDGNGNKYARALKISNRFPEELADFLPPERHTGDDEDHRMPIFDAVALALAYFKCKHFT